jgi:hypothetical protein
MTILAHGWLIVVVVDDLRWIKIEKVIFDIVRLAIVRELFRDAIACTE